MKQIKPDRPGLAGAITHVSPESWAIDSPETLAMVSPESWAIVSPETWVIVSPETWVIAPACSDWCKIVPGLFPKVLL